MSSPQNQAQNQASAPEKSPSEYEAERRKKRDALVEAGVNPYGRRTEGLIPLADARAKHDPAAEEPDLPSVKVAGRIVLKRDMGKLSFLTLRDETGDLQVGLQKNRLSETEWLIRKNLDLGDQIVVEGGLGTTKTGEPTVWAETLQMASKSLVPPPDKHKGLEDVELRYRQRYVDLWANPEVMRVMKLRQQIISRMRQYLIDHGYTEVETPMLQAIQGGAAARPFETHHNAYDIPLFLRIAPELYLKRLLVGGYGKVFEINRNFRNEGVSPRHNPEFTMLEAYEAHGNYETMAEMVEDMVCTIAQDVFGTLKIEHKNADGEITKTIDLERPWNRRSMEQLVEEYCDVKFDEHCFDDGAGGKIGSAVEAARLRELLPFARQYAPEVVQQINSARNEHDSDKVYTALISGAESCRDQLRKTLQETEDEHANARLRREIDDAEFAVKRVRDQGEIDIAFLFMSSWNQITSQAEKLQSAYEHAIEPRLIDPTFVTHVPSVIIPLARPNEDDPFFCDVYELAINGQEISPGYTELNDPDVQAELFRQQVGDEAEKQDVDEDFLNALKVGMPPAGGMGLGVDRLVMMLTGAESIRDVLLFPLMKEKS